MGEDLLRYQKLWISISKLLHPGDFVKQFPAVAKVFDDLRNDRIVSFESLVINSPATITIGISDDRSINVLKLVGQGVTSFYI